ncbi:tetratricopeptide repeat protein [Leptolyngbya sp. FACHB-17]|uniref:tetratricopeptide repeat protein n=1 Tax=unclassified Leptolyngbya TaxID=2650499 RepID=UPI00168130E2|nr:tetratricopeptide repeat protein [Leptolyngbya sp. FACHB-17]MBD2080065.1 tetratricopeptide repeat protein [Leptolyngbya sp. FACHB-17]
MQVSKRSVFPLLLTLTAAALTTGCDDASDAVRASTPQLKTDLALGDPAYYVNLGYELQQSRKYDEAIAVYRKAIILDMENADAYNGLGEVLTTQRRTEEALAAYRRSININPKNAAAYSGLGNALADRKRLEEAIAAYRRSIDANPQQMNAYTGLGNVLTQQKKISEAIASYQQALNAPEKTETAQAIAFVGLGRALQTQGRVDEALNLFYKATEIAPEYTWAHVFLGHTLANQEQFDQATAAYQAVLRQPNERKSNLGSSHAIAHNGLGAVLQRQGKVKDAIAQFEKAVETDLNYEAAHANLQRAKQLSAQIPSLTVKNSI